MPRTAGQHRELRGPQRLVDPDRGSRRDGPGLVPGRHLGVRLHRLRAAAGARLVRPRSARRRRAGARRFVVGVLLQRPRVLQRLLRWFGRAGARSRVARSSSAAVRSPSARRCSTGRARRGGLWTTTPPAPACTSAGGMWARRHGNSTSPRARPRPALVQPGRRRRRMRARADAAPRRPSPPACPTSRSAALRHRRRTAARARACSSAAARRSAGASPPSRSASRSSPPSCSSPPGSPTTWPRQRRVLKNEPGAGHRHPVEVYVEARRVEGLAPGVYHYAPTPARPRGPRPRARSVEAAGAGSATSRGWPTAGAARLHRRVERAQWRYRSARAPRPAHRAPRPRGPARPCSAASAMGLGDVSPPRSATRTSSATSAVTGRARSSSPSTALGRPAAEWTGARLPFCRPDRRSRSSGSSPTGSPMYAVIAATARRRSPAASPPSRSARSRRRRSRPARSPTASTAGA